MRRPHRRDAVVAAITTIVIAVLAVLVWWFTRDATDDPPGTEGSGQGAILGDSLPVTISGDVRGAISPGVMVPLDLSFDNPNDLSLTLDQVTVTVQRIEAPGADADHPCRVADFEVRQLSGGVVVTLDGTDVTSLSGIGVPREQWPAVGMINRPVNQDGCKGAVLTLTYQASGVEVRP